MFFVMFDDNVVVCETQLEAVELVDSLTLDGYRYISVGHNQPLNVDEMEEIEYDVQFYSGFSLWCCDCSFVQIY